MSKRAGFSYPWLAWIPLANVWVKGELVTDKLRGNGGIKFLIITLIYLATISHLTPSINVITGIIYGIFSILINFLIFAKYTNKATLHTILSVIIPLYSAIVLFVIRNNEDK
jgi:hypothetical protein